MRLIITEKNNSAKKIAEILSGGDAKADAVFRWTFQNVDKRGGNTFLYANGPVTSTWGKLRAEMGHPKPFVLTTVAIRTPDGAVLACWNDDGTLSGAVVIRASHVGAA